MNRGLSVLKRTAASSSIKPKYVSTNLNHHHQHGLLPIIPMIRSLSTGKEQSNSSIIVDATDLQHFCQEILEKSGSSPKESKIVSSNLVESNLKGHDSHGVGYLPRYIKSSLDKQVNINSEPIITRVPNTSFVKVDGQVCYGQVVGLKAMKAGIEVAKEQGIAVVAVKNSHHLGRIGAWSELCVEQNLCSIHFTNVSGHAPLVAPHNGTDARLGTNPFTVGFPNFVSGSTKSSPPLILDFATSEFALGKVREAFARGDLVKENVVIDSKGNHTTDPSVMFPEDVANQGALLPFSEHKGYALAFMCEVLGGIMSEGQGINPKYPRHKTRIVNSMTTIILDPLKLIGHDMLAKELADIKEYIRQSPTRDENMSILFPGERAYITYNDRMVNGIPVSKGTFQELCDTARMLGIETRLKMK